MSVEAYFEEMYEYSIDDLGEACELIKSNKKIDMDYMIYSLENEYNCLGIIELCYRKNLKEAREYFYKATLAREWFFEQLQKKEYADGEAHVFKGLVERNKVEFNTGLIFFYDEPYGFFMMSHPEYLVPYDVDVEIQTVTHNVGGEPMQIPTCSYVSKELAYQMQVFKSKKYL